MKSSFRKITDAIASVPANASAITMIAAFAVTALPGCGEIDQKAKTEKVYAGKKDEKPYDGQTFGADKTKWEVAIKDRNKTQNEYLRTEPTK